MENKKISLEQDKVIKNQRSLEYSGLCEDLNFQNDPDENQFYKTLTNANNVKITTETDLTALVTQRDEIVVNILNYVNYLTRINKNWIH